MHGFRTGNKITYEKWGQVFYFRIRSTTIISMIRPLRIELPGALYHLNARSNARKPIFRRVFRTSLSGRKRLPTTSGGTIPP
jgi:hypothetical protein